MDDLSQEAGTMSRNGMARSSSLIGRLAAPLAMFAIFAMFALAPSQADAQARGRQARQPRVIQLDEIRIEGRVQKPNAFYILNRSSIGYEVLDLRTSFTREVVRSVQREPF